MATIKEIVRKDIESLQDPLVEYEDVSTGNVLSCTFNRSNGDIVYTYETGYIDRYEHIADEVVEIEGEISLYKQINFTCKLTLKSQECGTANILLKIKERFKRTSPIDISTIALMST